MKLVCKDRCHDGKQFYESGYVYVKDEAGIQALADADQLKRFSAEDERDEFAIRKIDMATVRKRISEGKPTLSDQRRVVSDPAKPDKAIKLEVKADKPAKPDDLTADE